MSFKFPGKPSGLAPELIVDLRMIPQMPQGGRARGSRDRISAHRAPDKHSAVDVEERVASGAGDVDDGRVAYHRPARQAAPDYLAQAGQIRLDSGDMLGSAVVHTEPGDHLVVDDKNSMPPANLPQFPQERGINVCQCGGHRLE